MMAGPNIYDRGPVFERSLVTLKYGIVGMCGIRRGFANMNKIEKRRGTHIFEFRVVLFSLVVVPI